MTLRKTIEAIDLNWIDVKGVAHKECVEIVDYPDSPINEGPSLALQDRAIREIDLSPLENVTYLACLHLNHNNLRSIDLSPLKDSKGLKQIILHANELEAFPFEQLLFWKELEHLRLLGNRLKAVDLPALCRCPNLHRISVGKNPLGSVDLTPLAERPDIEWVSLFDCGLRTVNLYPLSGNRSLIGVELSDNALDTIDLSPLSDANGLEYLDLANNMLSTIDLDPLRGKANLKNLNLMNNQITSIDLSPLAKSINLREVGLKNNPLNLVNITPLFNCPEIDPWTILPIPMIADLSCRGRQDNPEELKWITEDGFIAFFDMTKIVTLERMEGKVDKLQKSMDDITLKLHSLPTVIMGFIEEQSDDVRTFVQNELKEASDERKREYLKLLQFLLEIRSDQNRHRYDLEEIVARIRNLELRTNQSEKFVSKFKEKAKTTSVYDLMKWAGKMAIAFLVPGMGAIIAELI